MLTEPSHLLATHQGFSRGSSEGLFSRHIPALTSLKMVFHCSEIALFLLRPCKTGLKALSRQKEN